MKNFRVYVPGLFALVCVFLLLNGVSVLAQTAETVSGNNILYSNIKNFILNGGKADVTELVLKRDRAVMNFNGTFYFTNSAGGKVTGAVFIGEGKFSAEIPPSEFEKNNVKRLLGEEIVESSFKTAVLRFTDDTFDIIGKNKEEAIADPKAQKLASEINDLILKETGANLSSRIVTSILNNERPGFFFANFDGGKRGQFSLLLDYQNRIPTSYFDINGGEKGIIFDYDSGTNDNEMWLAFYGLEDYQKGVVAYSDVNDLIDITHYTMDIDLREPKKNLGLKTKISMKALVPDINALPFIIGESLGESGKQRLKKQLRLKNARFNSQELDFIQEDWEGGFLVFLPKTVQAGENIDLDLEFEGDFVDQPDYANYCHYPRSNTSWYPRHGYLDRATYDLTYFHSKKDKIASVGVRQSEEISPEDKDVTITNYKMLRPVSFVTFAMGPFKRYTQEIKWDTGEKPIPLEYNSITYIKIKEDFILAELNNSVRYFHALFGQYPYENFGAAFHPFGFGQGFPSMLMIPGTDSANKYTYAFIAHETAHQWWGNIVAWRSYRDQWLSEGFAEYSGVLYTSLRDSPKASENLVDNMRNSLKDPPRTKRGLGKDRLVDVGPIILGHRLNTTKTYGAYNTLIYNKGALVLRMLHFMFTDPATGNGDAFFNMMKDFVERHRDKTASTDDFRQVANEHFVNTKIARNHKIKDLDWFFRQWVYETHLPSYGLDYTFEDQPDGSTIMTGTITQENVPENWAMVLPVVITLKNGTGAITAVALGPKNSFKIKLPARPQKVELDPQKWILSEKTKTN